MSTDHTPKVPDEAVEAVLRERERRDENSKELRSPIEALQTDLAAALPVIHAERDRAWREALNGEGEIDQARAALAEVDRIAGNWRHVNEDAAAILHAVEPLRSLIENTESALDSLQVSGAGPEHRYGACGVTGCTDCKPEFVDGQPVSDATDKPQPDQDRSPGEGAELTEPTMGDAIDALANVLGGRFVSLRHVPSHERDRPKLAEAVIAVLGVVARNPTPGPSAPTPQPDPQDQEGGARKAASRAVEEQARGTLEEQGLKPDDAADLVALARKRGEEMSAIDTDEPPQPHTSHGDREGERP